MVRESSAEVRCQNPQHVVATGRISNRRTTGAGSALAGHDGRRLKRGVALSVGARDGCWPRPAIVCRVSYTGDLGYEIYVAPRYQLALYDALHGAGQDLGLRPFGMRAMMSLRLEKSFGAWLREYRPDYTAAETGLDRFIHFANNDFIGYDAAVAERDTPPERALCTFVVDADDADVWADEPIWKDDAVVGFVTSGGYAHFVDKSVALGLIPRGLADADAAFEIEILGDRRPARLVTEALLDVEGARMRG